MAGFREFVTGEVLTAANVDDFLAKQVVQKYADAAARDAALGTAVAGGNALREGMVAWLDDTNSVIAYDGTAWNPVGAEPPAGIGSNVATVTLATQVSLTITLGTSSAITGLAVDFTPTTATSKALVIGHVTIASNTASTSRAVYVIVKRDGTPVGVGNTAGSRTATTSAGIPVTTMANITVPFMFVDSPATASEVTYTVELMNATDGTGHFVNRTSGDANEAANGRSSSTLTVIEVAP